MPKSEPCELPPVALLAKYLSGGAYTDCYCTDVAWPVSQAEFVEAFYSTAVFGIERRLLAWFVAKPSTIAQTRELAAGRLDQFAAWHVEGRNAHQLLLSDFLGRTRSWLMTAPIGPDGSAGTHLYFGSAVVPIVGRKSDKANLGFALRALLGSTSCIRTCFCERPVHGWRVSTWAETSKEQRADSPWLPSRMHGPHCRHARPI